MENIKILGLWNCKDCCDYEDISKCNYSNNEARGNIAKLISGNYSITCKNAVKILEDIYASKLYIENRIKGD